MRALIQRVSRASVTIEDRIAGQIEKGLLVLVGIESEDGEDDLQWLARKIVQLRIFADESGAMNRSVMDVEGGILVVSQFTLHAKVKKGTRPSFIKAARPETAIPLYQAFLKQVEMELGKPVESGEFGAMMQIELINDGPVTIWIDTKNKE